MVSFCTLWENMENNSISKNDISDKAISVVKTGLQVDEYFWENFLRVMNNSSGLSELLDVPSEKIAKWHSRIKDALKEINDDYRTERIAALKDVYVKVLSDDAFIAFMGTKGKLGSAHKFPRVLKGKLLEEWQTFIANYKNTF